MFDEGGFVRWVEEVVENGVGKQTATPAIGEQYPATCRPVQEQWRKMGKMEER